MELPDDFVLDGAGIAIEQSATQIDLDPALPERGKVLVDLTQDSCDSGEPVYFDIETIPDYSRIESFGLEPLPAVPDEADAAVLPPVAEVASGTADQIKKVLRGGIMPAAWLADLLAAEDAGKARSGVKELIAEAGEARQKIISMHESRLKLLSTTPEYCSVAVLAWAVGNRPVNAMVWRHDLLSNTVLAGEGYISTGCNERELLGKFWSAISNGAKLIGYNCLSFDLPVLMVRSMMLDVEPSRVVNLSPYGNRDVLDVYIARFGRGGNTDKQRPGKMKSLAKVYGIDVPAGDVDGGSVDALMKQNPIEAARYCISDVLVLRHIHRKLSGYFYA